MLSRTQLLFSKKLNEKCNLDDSSLIYSLIPELYEDFQILDTFPDLIDGGIQIFSGEKSNHLIFKKKDNLLKELSFFNITGKISTNKTHLSLALLSNIYFNCFFRPIQFFLPLSSFCSGHFVFWNKIDYLQLKKNFKNKEYQMQFSEKLTTNNIWNLEFNPENFSYVVRKRIEKETSSNKLNSEAMIKALIIRLGELTLPSLSYENIDLSLRKFLRYINLNKYLRVDRELFFLKQLEKGVQEIIENTL
jgi:hypothetical protein